MHRMLQPWFAAKLSIAAGALWCAWTVSAVTGKISAPSPAAADQPQPFTLIVRTIPIFPELSFSERWQAPLQAMQQVHVTSTDVGAQQAADKLKKDEMMSRHAARQVDPVCGSKGRRYFHIGRILSWRCNR